MHNVGKGDEWGMRKKTTTYPWKVTLIIQNVQNPKRSLADEIKAGLVVSEVDGLPVDTLSVVLLLLQLEDVLIEVKLELLIGKVDTQLLKTVHLKILQLLKEIIKLLATLKGRC